MKDTIMFLVDTWGVYYGKYNFGRARDFEKY